MRIIREVLGVMIVPVLLLIRLCPLKFADRNAESLDIFWINMDKSLTRKVSTMRMLKFMGLKNNERISAVTPASFHFPTSLHSGLHCRSLSPDLKASELENTKNLRVSASGNHTHSPRFLLTSFCGAMAKTFSPEVSCVLSHLYTIYRAIHREDGSGSDYALILEDDVSLSYEVDFAELIKTAPKDFAVLQLVILEENELTRLWDKYHQNLSNPWNLRDRISISWSTGAYIINKRRMKEAISNYLMVEDEKENIFSVKLDRLGDTNCECCSKNDRLGPSFRCIYVFWHYSWADFVVYNIVPDASYTFALPLFSPSSEAMDSTIHQGHVDRHSKAWQAMKRLSQEMIRNQNDSWITNILNPHCSLPSSS